MRKNIIIDNNYVDLINTLEEQKPDRATEESRFLRILLLNSAANSVMWTIWYSCYAFGEYEAIKSSNSWCAEKYSSCYFSTITLFVALGSMLGSSCIYLLESNHKNLDDLISQPKENYKDCLANNIGALLPDIAFIFTDYSSSLVSEANTLSFPWPNVLVNSFGLFVIQALTMAILKGNFKYFTKGALTTGVSAAFYTIAATLTQDSDIEVQVLGIAGSTACAPSIAAGAGTLFNKLKDSFHQCCADYLSKTNTPRDAALTH